MVAKEVRSYRERLEAKRHELIGEIARIEVDGREATVDADTQDRADHSYTKESLFQQSDYERAVLGLVQSALRRAEEGAYGICVECGRPVEKKRLNAVPWARHCISCQKLQDR